MGDMLRNSAPASNASKESDLRNGSIVGHKAWSGSSVCIIQMKGNKYYMVPFPSFVEQDLSHREMTLQL